MDTPLEDFRTMGTKEKVETAGQNMNRVLGADYGSSWTDKGKRVKVEVLPAGITV